MTSIQQQERFNKEDESCLRCPVCGNDFLVELRISRFTNVQASAVGQGLPMTNDLNFPIYLCLRKGCNKVIVPSVDGLAVGGRRWDLFEKMASILDPLE